MTSLTDFISDRREALVGYVRRRLDDAAAQDAEDIVQDVIVGLFDRADPTIPIQNLAAFVYRALRNRIIDRIRKKRETVPLPENVPDDEDDPLRALERRADLEAVFAAMDGLSAEEKAVVLATEFEGHAFKDLSAEWGTPIGTLLARKSRAIEKIRNRLTGRIDQQNQGVSNEPSQRSS
jgi:RNA polymerase sigma factor (sigma-70 family)